MKTFEIGQTYTMRSACMRDCTWSYTVTKRTAQTITTQKTAAGGTHTRTAWADS